MDEHSMTFTIVSIFSPRTLRIFVGVPQTSQQAVSITAADLQGVESVVDEYFIAILSRL